jgi:multiple sugar transport system substrate-binding protein
MHRTRVAGLVATGLIGLSTLLAACGGATVTQSPAAPSVSPAASTGASTEPSTAPSASASAEPVTITWSTWGTPEELTRFVDFDKTFMKRHPNITLKLVPVPSYGDYHPKLLTELTAGTAPDVFYVGDDSIGKFVTTGQLTDLTQLAGAADSPAKLDQFFPALLAPAEADGKLYGLTTDSNPNVLWYNPELLKAVGITEMPADLVAQGKWDWATFRSMTEKLRAAGKHGYLFWNWFADTYTWVRANGGQVYQDGKSVIADDPKSLAAFAFIADNIKAKNFTWADNLPSGSGADTLFISGKAGFESSGRWLLAELRAGKRTPGTQYDIVSFPTADGSPMQPHGVATAFLSINTKTPHLAEAWLFLSEFVSQSGQEFRLKDKGNAVPAIKGAEDVVLAGGDPPHARTFLDVRDTGFADPGEETRVPGLVGDINKALEPLWQGRGSVDATIKALQDMINSRIAAQ